MDDFKDVLDDKDFRYYFNKYKKYILPGIILILILIIVLLLLLKPNKKQEISVSNNNKTLKEPKKEVKKIKTFKVDIKGQVVNPGVYELEEGSRVIDVINKAEGLKENADTSYINLSKKIEDEMVIIIYSYQEVLDYKYNKKQKYEEIENKCDCPDNMNDACITKEKQTKKTNSKTNSKTNKEENNSLISINEADLEELQKITGIGKSKAESIIKYREENGSFKSIEEIKEVSGIGESLFEKIKNEITV